MNIFLIFLFNKFISLHKSISPSLPSLSTFDLDSRTLPTITITPPYNLLTNSTLSLTTLEGERSTSRRGGKCSFATVLDLPPHLEPLPVNPSQLDGVIDPPSTSSTSTSHLPLHLRHPPSPLAQLDGQEGEGTTCTTSTTTSSSSTPSSTPTSTSTCTSTPREAPTPLPRKCPCPCPAPHAPGALWNCAAPPPRLPP